MKPFFTIHPGEFLVGDHVTRRLGKKYDVWVPAKDSGVDLLLTARGRSHRNIKLQVKFSRSYGKGNSDPDEFLARGWYVLKTNKILNSPADFWVFVILDLRQQSHFIVVPLRQLMRRMPRKVKLWHLYLTVFKRRRCFDTRGMSAADERAASRNGVVKRERDYTAFLNKWNLND